MLVGVDGSLSYLVAYPDISLNRLGGGHSPAVHLPGPCGQLIVQRSRQIDKGRVNGRRHSRIGRRLESEQADMAHNHRISHIHGHRQRG